MNRGDFPGSEHHQRGQHSTPDLSTLVDPQLKTIINVLQERFRSQQIYTNIGDVLLSCNPCRSLPLYGHQVGSSYTRVENAVTLPPHIYTTACRAHRYLSLHNTDQAVILLGESGSGKTESLKMLVSQLGRLSPDPPDADRQSGGVAFLLAEALHILDEFGNADTGVNMNASRFGKLMETVWEGGKLIGAEIVCQGLEKSRVMYPGEGERNFHVFYRMLAGFDPDLLRLHQHTQSYRVLEPSEGGSIFRDRSEGEAHRDSYHYLRQCLVQQGIDQQTAHPDIPSGGTSLFEILSALLHLGNVHFAPDPETDTAFVANPPEVEAAARLLGVRVDDLLSLTLTGVRESRGAQVEYHRDVGGASRTRNSLVRYIYEELFHWLVEAVNLRIKPADKLQNPSVERRVIQLLDLPGYENLRSNSLEQLHHNMADERMRQYVIDHVIRQESDDLDRDGVKGPRFQISTQVFDVFYNREQSLLRLLDEHSGHHSNSDQDLLRAVRKTYKKSNVVQTGDTAGGSFTINHYRGQVVYDMGVLLAKNTPVNTRPYGALLYHSRNPILQDIAQRDGVHDDDYDDDAENPTATRKYASSLSAMLERVEESEAQYVCCVRPNMTSAPDFFDEACVARQLDTMNVTEIAELRSRGYPIRLPLREFIERYKFIGYPLTARLESLAGACHRVIRVAGVPDGGWMVKSRKVFVTLWQQDYLDGALARALGYVVFVQCRVRGFIARRRVTRMRHSLQQEGEVLQQFTDHVTELCLSAFYACQCQNDHNILETERKYTGRDGGRRQSRRHSERTRRDDYQNSNTYYNDERYRGGGGGEVYSAYIEQQSDEMTDFTQSVLHDVLSKHHQEEEEENNSWAKILCMEYDEPVGKFYIQHREITIDGSYTPYDGNRMGLGILRNPNRDRETENIRGHLGKGLTLSRDPDGNIWMKRLTQNEVIVEGHTDPANHSLSADVILAQGRLPLHRTIKVFDMNELRSRIGIEMKSATFNRKRLLQQTVTCVSLLTSGATPLDTPCWLCIVNLAAINVLQDPQVLSGVERMVAQLSMRTEKDRERSERESEAFRRHGRKSWSRVNQRESITHQESPRKARQALRDQGETISDHMHYSWETSASGHPSKKQLASIQGQFRGEGHSSLRSHGSGRQWAKAMVVAKESRLKDEWEDQKTNMSSRY